jgi:hypothetical protein
LASWPPTMVVASPVAASAPAPSQTSDKLHQLSLLLRYHCPTQLGRQRLVRRRRRGQGILVDVRPAGACHRLRPKRADIGHR